MNEYWKGQGKMLSILAVDDEVAICEIIRDFLKTKGYKVRTAQSEEKALELISDEKPDMVFLDLNMPGIGGKATLREIKKSIIMIFRLSL